MEQAQTRDIVIEFGSSSSLPTKGQSLCSTVHPRSGVLMWEVFNEGRLPYENRSNAEVVEYLNSGLRLLKPRLAPDAAHLLMEWCWKEVSTGV